MLIDTLSGIFVRCLFRKDVQSLFNGVVIKSTL